LSSPILQGNVEHACVASIVPAAADLAVAIATAADQ
jgi:hypothetical protein